MKIGGTLSAWELAKASFRFVWTHRGDYLRAAAIPCMASALCSVIGEEIGTLAVKVPLDLGSTAFSAILAVKWHRCYLIGPEAARPSWVPTFGARELRFGLYLLAGHWGGLLVFWNLMWPLGMAFQWNFLFFPFVMILLIPLALFLIGRLSLVFPAAAVGVGGGVAGHVAGSWRSMRDSTWSVVGAELLVSVPLILLFAPLVWVGVQVTGPVWVALSVLVGMAASVAGFGVIVTTVSIAFDDLTPWREGRLVKGKK